MLQPAAIYKEQIEKKSQELYYTEDLMLYSGYPDNERIEVQEDPRTDLFEFASVDKDGKLVGYITFRYSAFHSCADRFGMISFDKGNTTLIRDVHQCLDMLINQFRVHRLEWFCVDTNPVKRHYDKFCNKYNGTIHRYRDVWRDLKGQYHDSYVYEVLFDQNTLMQ